MFRNVIKSIYTVSSFFIKGRTLPNVRYLSQTNVANNAKTAKYIAGAIATIGGFTCYTLFSAPKIRADEAEKKTMYSECSDPVCHDNQEMFMMATDALGKKGVKQPAAYTSKESEFTVKDADGKIRECPPTRELLGRHSWTLLHSIAAYYPDNPTDDDKKYALQFLDSFSHLYPCKVCASHMQKALKKNPPNVNSRQEFMLYICSLHNSVNRTLLKPVYPCKIELLEERWRTGCKECWTSGNKTKMSSEESINCKDMKKFGLGS